MINLMIILKNTIAKIQKLESLKELQIL